MNEEIKEILDGIKIIGRNDLDYLLRNYHCNLLLDYINNLQRKVEELEKKDNIINELEKWLKEKQELTCGCGITVDYLYAYENCLDKLKELKENNNV